MGARALVLGYFGANNWGDELILRSFLQTYREMLQATGMRLSVTMKQPPHQVYREDLKALYPGLRFTAMSPFLPVSPALSSYRFLFCPGGSLLQNVTSNRSLKYYLGIIGRFTRGQRKALLLNQGLGPISGDRFVQATRRTLSRVALFTARDEDTLAWMRTNVPRANLQLSSDAAFAGEQEFATAGDTHPQRVFVFALREGIAEEAMEFALGSVPRTHSVYLAALQTVDLHYLRDLRARTRFPHERVKVMGAGEFARRLPGCSVVVSERYHGLVAALIARVPFVGIGDDPKIVSFCKEAGMPYFVRDALHEATAEELLNRARASYDRQRMDKLISTFRQRQDEQKKLVAAIIQAEGKPASMTDNR